MARRGGGGGDSSPPLSRFGVLVAQLESIVASAPHRPPDALLCFDLLSQLSEALREEPKESLQLWQRKCEDALFSLLALGARRPVRRLASSAMGSIIEKGDEISVYSRVSTIQGWLSDSKKSEPLSSAGLAHCLGELYQLFGRRITAGLGETVSTVAKLMKFYEDFVRQDALSLLENALEGSGGSGASAAYMEAFRIIMRVGVSDKSSIVRVSAARCLKAFASIGGPGLGFTELDNSMSICIKGLDDDAQCVRDSYSEALGALLALAMTPDAQVKKAAKGQVQSIRTFDDGVQKYLIVPFIKAAGIKPEKLRVGVALSWVFFLQTVHLKYHVTDSDLQKYAIQVLDVLKGDIADPHSLACVLYILRVGVADQMAEPVQRNFLLLMAQQLETSVHCPFMRVAALRMLSYLLTTLGEVPVGFKDVLDNTVVAALSHPSVHVRVEAALTIRTLAVVDPTCVGGLISYGVTTLHALRESVSSFKGDSINIELNSLHGQATFLAALVSVSSELPLGYPSRLPKSALELAKVMLNGFSRNSVAAIVEREAAWLLLASLISSMPKEELEDQIFDILLLWAGPFTGNPESYLRHVNDWASELRVLSVAIEALAAFIKTFVSSTNAGVNGGNLLNPVLSYLGGALSLISSLCSKPLQNMKFALDLFTTQTLIAYRTVANPMAYKSEHLQLIQICCSPFSDPFGWQESSCLRNLLDKRDACLGPWVPGRDSFEDELRAFEGGNDGLLPRIWDNEVGSFPQPEPVSKMLVNQMLLCYGTMFACQDNTGKAKLLNQVDQCLKSGRKHPFYMSCITNVCVGLLSGLKAMLSIKCQALSPDLLSSMLSIFQAILMEVDISSSQRRAACEGLGLLSRLGNDTFTARLTRSILGELTAAADPCYIGSIAFSLGCIHRCAGGMALSSLVPSTVNSLSTLSRRSNSTLQLWSLHSLLLTIEAAGLSYFSQVQGTLSLAMEILLLDEIGSAVLRQEVGHIINAIVAVVGPELAPGSTFFSRCKSIIAEISSCRQTGALLESVRFIQQLVLFAPQAVSVHSHVLGLIPTLSSRQPSLRHLAVSTLHHLIERDPVAMINEKIEENLFNLLDEETDTEISSLVRATIIRLLYTSCPQCPSRWLDILRNMVLATTVKIVGESLQSSRTDHLNNIQEVDKSYGDDSEDMIAHSKGLHFNQSLSFVADMSERNRSLRYRTRVFAAECLSCLPTAVGAEPGHFDLSIARTQLKRSSGTSTDWLVLRLQDLVSVSYQISTGQFEGMQPIGVRLLSLLMDKFGEVEDPELPGHILLEQFQAQLVSAIRSAVNSVSSPALLEAGLELATKVLTSPIITGDQLALNRLFMMILRPLNDLQDLYYPSFADWVVCKIKVRLLTAHASVKCHTYLTFEKKENATEEYLQLAPLLASSSELLGKYWLGLLKDYNYISFHLHSKYNHKPFLDGIQSLVVSSKVQMYLADAWPLILWATVLDSAPAELVMSDADVSYAENFISGHSMVNLDHLEFQFLWGMSLIVLFMAKQSPGDDTIKIKPLQIFQITKKTCSVLYMALPMFIALTRDIFFTQGFITVEICQELLQALLLFDGSSDMVRRLFTQVIKYSPDSFFDTPDFVFVVIELCTHLLCVSFQSSEPTLASELYILIETLVKRLRNKLLSVSSVVVSCYQSVKENSTILCFSKVILFLQNFLPFLKKLYEDEHDCQEKFSNVKPTLEAIASILSCFVTECIDRIGDSERKSGDSSKGLTKILFICLGECISLARFVYEYACLDKCTKDDGLIVSRFCSKIFHDSLCCTNIQVQILVLRVLKTAAQTELTGDSEVKGYLFMLLVGDLLEDIFSLLNNTLMKCQGKEHVLIIEETLKFLVLFITLAKGRRFQQQLTLLLLEALFTVFSYSHDHLSAELHEVHSIAKRMVSQIVQISSTAVQIKDVMISLPVARRQQFQDMIRALVNPEGLPSNTGNQERNAGEGGKDNSHSVFPQPYNDGFVGTTETDSKIDDDDEDDDNWDAFQSLPANSSSAFEYGSIADRKDEVASAVSVQHPDPQLSVEFSAENILHTSSFSEETPGMYHVSSSAVGSIEQNKIEHDPSGLSNEDGEVDESREEASHLQKDEVALTEGFTDETEDHNLVGEPTATDDDQFPEGHATSPTLSDATEVDENRVVSLQDATSLMSMGSREKPEVQNLEKPVPDPDLASPDEPVHLAALDEANAELTASSEKHVEE